MHALTITLRTKKAKKGMLYTLGDAFATNLFVQVQRNQWCTKRAVTIFKRADECVCVCVGVMFIQNLPMR